ncbi:MAG: hypothetical protein ACRYHQ_13850 [Janthinobacterium lividum]
MSASATQATPQDDPGPGATDTPYYCGVLHGMIDRGADLTRLLHELAIAHAAQQATALAQQAAAPTQQAAAPALQAMDTPPAPAPLPAPPPAPDAIIRIVASFDQIARAVRRCIAQAQSLDAPKQQQPARAPTQDRTTARKRIIRAIEDVIQRPPDNDECDDAEILLSDLRERMDTPDLEDDIANRPAEDIIKEILRDLGLAALPGSRPWKRRTPTDIAALNARAAAPSSRRQPIAEPQDGKPGPTCQAPDPQPGHPATARPFPDPAAQPESGHPAAPARSHIQPGPTLPENPAEAVAFVLRHYARTNVRWRPPPGD